MSTLSSVIEEGLAASRPTAGIAGRLYYATDTNALSYDNGSSWDSWTPGGGGSGGAWTNITGSVTWTGATASGGIATVGSDIASVTASVIPGSYNHLYLTALMRTSDATTIVDVFHQLNGDTGSNYDDEQFESNGGSNSSNAHSAQANWRVWNAPGSTASANVPAMNEMWLYNYASTTYYKTSLCRGNAFATLGTTTAYYQIAKSGIWRSTAAITSIKIYSGSGGNVVAGSIFSLYGIT